MSIKKRNYIDFLEAVEAKARKSVAEKYEEMIEAAKVLKLEPYMKRVMSCQDRINRLKTDVDSLVLDMSEDLEVAYSAGGWNSIEYDLAELAGENGKQKLINKCRFKGEITILENKRDKEIQEVSSNYNKVKQVCNRLPSGKKVAEYLKGLGFDIASLEKGEDSSLIANIDKSKLFVCGDNK